MLTLKRKENSVQQLKDRGIIRKANYIMTHPLPDPPYATFTLFLPLRERKRDIITFIVQQECLHLQLDRTKTIVSFKAHQLAILGRFHPLRVRSKS